MGIRLADHSRFARILEDTTRIDDRPRIAERSHGERLACPDKLQGVGVKIKLDFVTSANRVT